MLSTYASRFTINTMRRAYRLFDGDLTLFLVFGEIAHYNMSRALQALSVRDAPDSSRWRVLIRALDAQKVTPCNALSISAATGIPRETVRRKVKELEKRGWLVREGPRSLTLAPRAIEQMGASGRAIMEDFLETARVIRVLEDAFTRQQRQRDPGADQ
jgi:DNA-binding MarR family transcriptional regulator